MTIFPSPPFDKEARTKSLLRLVPDIFTLPRKILYVGARTDRFDYGKELQKVSTLCVLEIFKPNYEFLKTIPGITAIHGDVKTCPLDNYDLVFWWHGPEHIQRSDLPATLYRLERISPLIVLGCPWGDYQQNALYGNEHEKHISHYDAIDFEALGYTVECLGQKNKIGSHITSVKASAI